MKKYIVPKSEPIIINPKDILLLSSGVRDQGMIADYSEFDYID